MAISIIVTKIHQWSKNQRAPVSSTVLTNYSQYLSDATRQTFFYFLNSYASLLHTAPVHIQLYPLPSVCFTSWKWRRKPFCHNAARLLDMSPVSVTDRLHEHLNVLLRAVWQWASSLSLCRHRMHSQLTSPGLRGRRTGPVAGSGRAALQRGRLAWCSPVNLIHEHLVHDLEAFLMFCSKIVIPALWFIFWIAQLWFTSSDLWSFLRLVPCWFSWKKEWWHHLLVEIFNP